MIARTIEIDYLRSLINESRLRYIVAPQLPQAFFVIIAHIFWLGTTNKKCYNIYDQYIY